MNNCFGIGYYMPGADAKYEEDHIEIRLNPDVKSEEANEGTSKCMAGPFFLISSHESGYQM